MTMTQKKENEFGEKTQFEKLPFAARRMKGHSFALIYLALTGPDKMGDAGGLDSILNDIFQDR
jgi:hypothetical protein